MDEPTVEATAFEVWRYTRSIGAAVDTPRKLSRSGALVHGALVMVQALRSTAFLWLLAALASPWRSPTWTSRA